MVKINLIFCLVLSLFCTDYVIGNVFIEVSKYSGHVYKIYETDTCTNLRDEDWRWIKSVRSNTCVIVYGSHDCKGRISRKILPSNETNNMSWFIKSFHACNIEEGGPKLNIDIIEYFEYWPLDLPPIIISYKDICSCVNIPTSVQQMDRWSINNHGNELMAYFEPNCSAKTSIAYAIPAGGSWKSFNIYREPIQSFGPHPNSSYFNENCFIFFYEEITNADHLPNSNSTWAQMNGFTQSNSNRSTKNLQTTVNGDTKVHFFGMENFNDFLFEKNISTTCTNILESRSHREGVHKTVSSIKTNACVMLYSQENCFGRSMKLQAGEFQNLRSEWESTYSGSDKTLASSQFFRLAQNGLVWNVTSFKGCSYQEGGYQLNVDITEYHPKISTNKSPIAYRSYRNVCTCQNIPSFVRDLDNWSLNNYGNSLVVYFEQDCSSVQMAPLVIPPGRNLYSIKVGSFEQNRRKILSLGPNVNADYFQRNCIKMSTSVVRFFVFETENGNTVRNVEMDASKSDFYNDSPAQVVQTFTASKVVRQLYSIDIGTSLSKMSRVEVDTNFDIESKKTLTASQSSSLSSGIETAVSTALGGSVSGFGAQIETSLGASISTTDTSTNSVTKESGFREGLRKAFENTGSLSSTQTNVRSEETTKSFTKTQQITVPACTAVTVHAYVKMVTSGETMFKALTKIRGEIGGRMMTAEEVRKYMNSQLEYAGDFDDKTVWAYSSGSLTAEYGVSAFINATGYIIPGCINRGQ